MRSTKSFFSTHPMHGALCSSRMSRSALTLIFWSTSVVNGFKSVGGLGYLSSQTVSSFLDRRCNCIHEHSSMWRSGQDSSLCATHPHRYAVRSLVCGARRSFDAYLAYFWRGKSHGDHLRHVFLDHREGIAQLGFFVLGRVAVGVDRLFHLVAIRSLRSFQHPIQGAHTHLAGLAERAEHAWSCVSHCARSRPRVSQPRVHRIRPRFLVRLFHPCWAFSRTH